MSSNSVIDMGKLNETFFIESEEHISNMESFILELERNPHDKETLNAIFRAAHSMKGNSGCLGFNEINSFTHTLETVLDRLRNGGMEVTADLVSLLLESVDCVKALVDGAKEERGCLDEVTGTLKKLKALLEGDGAVTSAVVEGKDEAARQAVGVPSEALFKIVFKPGSDTFRRGIDPINNILKRIGNAGEVLKSTACTSGLPDIAVMDPESNYLSWEVLLLTQEDASSLEDIFEFIKDGSIVEIVRLIPPATGDCAAQPVAIAHIGKHSEHSGAPVSGSQGEAALFGGKMIGEILVDDMLITRGQLNEALKKQGGAHRGEATTIRVDTEKVDKLVNLIGELIITQSMVARFAANPSVETSASLQNVAIQLERNTKELQERIMSIRMLPVGSVFNRFTRLVRDISQARGKKVSLAISGEDTELDKTVIEKISDPLTHLIRNSIDHGIEHPEERGGKGKPEAGTIRLDASHSGGHVIITVEDDGRGLDREKIVRKAVEKGLITAHEADNLADAKAYDLIFLPGFSTADKITDVSGRGVGMDVVKRNMEELGGSVSVESNYGIGMKIALRIPLTLAIIDGLTVKVGRQTFVLPIHSVFESLRPKRDEVKMIKGELETVNIRGHWIPLIRLYRLFSIEPRENDPCDSLIVVAMTPKGNFALMVDELIGEQQVVIKNMGEGFRNIPGIAGATILGDGGVALILDIGGIVKHQLRI